MTAAGTPSDRPAMIPRSRRLLVRGLRGFARVWFVLAGALIVLGALGILSARGWRALAETFSPLNFWNAIALLLTLAPGVLARRWADRIEQGQAPDSPALVASPEQPSVRVASSAPAPAPATLLPGETRSGWVKRVRSAQPPEQPFSAMLASLPATEQREIVARAALLDHTMGGLADWLGIDGAECERRYYAAMLVDLYPAEVAGDYAATDDRARETVRGLMAGGLALETVIHARDPRALSRTYPANEHSPVVRSRQLMTEQRAALTAEARAALAFFERLS